MSDNNPQVTFLKKIYSILTAANGADTSIQPIGPMYIAFCSPGIPLPKSALNFDMNTKNGLTNLAQWSQLVNIIPEATSMAPIYMSYKPSSDISGLGTWTAAGSKVNDIYDDFLNGAECKLLELSDDEKSMHDNAYKYLNVTKETKNPITGKTSTKHDLSDDYKDYIKYKLNYETAVNAYNVERINSITSEDPAVKSQFGIKADMLQNKIKSSLDEWIGFGNKEYVEEAIDTLANLSGKSFVQQLSDAQNQFNTSVMTDPILGRFYPTPPVPIEFFEEPESSVWITYQYDHTEQTKFNNVSANNIGGSTGGLLSNLSAFGFNVGIDADIKTNSQVVYSDEDIWKVTFDLVQLPLARGWIRNDLLESNKWFWRKNSAEFGKAISVGHIPIVPPEKALMPVYPTSVLLVRNVDIKTKTSKLQKAVSSYDASTNVHIGWGPFNLGSVKTHNTSSTDYNHVTIDENGLKSDGISIIGFVCSVIEDKLPQGSPN